MKSTTIQKLFFSFYVICLPALSQSETQEAFPNLSFSRPVDIQHAGDSCNRLFVAEQRGVIRVFKNDSSVTNSTVFLDIQNRVDISANEEGLLGLAFHPDYENNGYFYVNYTALSPVETRISRFKVSENDSNIAVPDSEVIIITIPKPYSNHNAGQIVFGPNDGYLYITTGDGGQGGDPLNSGQDRTSLLGAILRIDVDSTANGLNYAIPGDNPFEGNVQGYREEIYAYGLRNPWRVSFDPLTGWLWAGDVGQDAWEEIDIIDSGRNYGWRIMEGNHCFNPPNCANDTVGLTIKLPVWEYFHSGGNISITGGQVYRGPGVPELAGLYIYADFGSGRIWSLDFSNLAAPLNSLIIDTPHNISTFGVDANNELYFAHWGFTNTKIYRFKPTISGRPDVSTIRIPGTVELGQNFPNPFNSSTKIPFKVNQSAKVKISIFNLNGERVSTVVDTMMPPGHHAVFWDGAGFNQKALPSGIYFYELKVDEKIADTKRLVLLK